MAVGRAAVSKNYDSVMNRICIGQLVRPDGSVLTEGLSSEEYGPTFGYNAWTDDEGIKGPIYGRWRFTDEDQWRVTYYWPKGEGSLPMYVDNTGEGQFMSFDPRHPSIERDDAALALRKVIAASPSS